MDPTSSPFGALTFIAAPALLTNATSVLVMSTTSRMLRTRDSMSALLSRSEHQHFTPESSLQLTTHVNRLELQAGLLLSALYITYMALGSFAGATLVTLIGAALTPLEGRHADLVFAFIGLVLGAIGVACLVVSSFRLFRATQLSLITIHEDASVVRGRARDLQGVAEAPTPARPAQRFDSAIDPLDLT